MVSYYTSRVPVHMFRLAFEEDHSGTSKINIGDICIVRFSQILTFISLSILGTLNPALQDRNGKPKKSVSTIIHILNDLLGASPQYRAQMVHQQRHHAGARHAERMARTSHRMTSKTSKYCKCTCIITTKHPGTQKYLTTKCALKTARQEVKYLRPHKNMVQEGMVF